MDTKKIKARLQNALEVANTVKDNKKPLQMKIVANGPTVAEVINSALTLAESELGEIMALREELIVLRDQFRKR